LPHPAAGRSNEQVDFARLVTETGQRGDPAAHGRRADVAGPQAGNGSRVDDHRARRGFGACNGHGSNTTRQNGSEREFRSHLRSPWESGYLPDAPPPCAAVGTLNIVSLTPGLASAFSNCTFCRSVEPFWPDSCANGRYTPSTCS